jgi:glutamine amidotransferase
MCRHLAAVGDTPFRLAPLLFELPHALAVQAREPRYQASGDDNPDGWGVAWYEPGDDEPNWYRTTTPIWRDDEFVREAKSIDCTAVLAAARLASPGATIDVTGNAPFVSGRWSFSLNGIVYGFHDGVGDELRARISEARRAEIEGDSDTEALFAMTLDRLDGGDTPQHALAAVVKEVLAITTGRLNILLTDGHVVHGTRVGNSLFARPGVVASEPLDNADDWREVPEERRVFTTVEPRSRVLKWEGLA